MTGTRVLCITAADRTAAYADALLILLRAGEIVKGEGEKAMIALGLDWDDMHAARQRADRALKGLNHPITPVAAPPPVPGRPSAPPRPSTTPSVVPQQYHPNASRKRPTRDGDLFCARHDDGAGAWLPPHRFALRIEKGRETSGARRSWCQDCTSAYQRARYLSVSQVDDTDCVRAAWVHSPADPQVPCCRCGQPIADDERVEMVGAPHHAGECPTSPT
jgi:hypothetical protein